jgi:hypothetical protein
MLSMDGSIKCSIGTSGDPGKGVISETSQDRGTNARNTQCECARCVILRSFYTYNASLRCQCCGTLERVTLEWNKRGYCHECREGLGLNG